MAIVEDDDGISINLRHPERYEAKTANKVYLGVIDLKLFKLQRGTLHRMIEDMAADGRDSDALELTGLENLLDCIYDQLVPPHTEVLPYPPCECGHRYDRHTDPGDPRKIGCWECECTEYKAVPSD